MVVAGTGHRPDKLGGYGERARERLVDLAVAAIKRYNPERVVSGMALGWDMALAEAAIALEIPLTAAVPFKGQEGRWPKESQERYTFLLDQCDEVVIVCEGGYSPQKMSERNQWMCDHCDLVLALWNGTPGGTANCVAYAQKTSRRLVNLWSSWVAHSGLPV